MAAQTLHIHQSTVMGESTNMQNDREMAYSPTQSPLKLKHTSLSAPLPKSRFQSDRPTDGRDRNSSFQMPTCHETRDDDDDDNEPQNGQFSFAKQLLLSTEHCNTTQTNESYDLDDIHSDYDSDVDSEYLSEPEPSPAPSLTPIVSDLDDLLDESTFPMPIPSPLTSPMTDSHVISVVDGDHEMSDTPEPCDSPWTSGHQSSTTFAECNKMNELESKLESADELNESDDDDDRDSMHNDSDSGTVYVWCYILEHIFSLSLSVR